MYLPQLFLQYSNRIINNKVIIAKNKNFKFQEVRKLQILEHDMNAVSNSSKEETATDTVFLEPPFLVPPLQFS